MAKSQLPRLPVLCLRLGGSPESSFVSGEAEGPRRRTPSRYDSENRRISQFVSDQLTSEQLPSSKSLQVFSDQRRSSALVRDKPRYEKTIFFQKMRSRSSQIAFGNAGGWGSVWKKNVPPFSAFDLRKWPFFVFFHLFPPKNIFIFAPKTEIRMPACASFLDCC
jgi:hypothetical protein